MVLKNSENNSIQDKDKDTDSESVFNKKNLEFNLFSFLIYKLTLGKSYSKYKIYSDFRDKILCDEQIIKNHISLYNLQHNNNPSTTIYSLRDVINDNT